MKIFGLLVWLVCSNGPADYGIPTSPEMCERMGPSVATEIRQIHDQPVALVIWRCGLFEAPMPDDICYP